jgi:hypothetical protein
MCAYTRPNPCQTQVLIQPHHMYTISDERINVCAMSLKNANELVQNFTGLLLMLLMILNIDLILKIDYNLQFTVFFTFSLFYSYHFCRFIFWLTFSSWFFYHILRFSFDKKNRLICTHTHTRYLCTFYLSLILNRTLNNQNSSQSICIDTSHMLSIKFVLFLMLISAWCRYTYHWHCSSFFFFIMFTIFYRHEQQVKNGIERFNLMGVVYT